MIEQGTDAWKQQRLGKVTASRISDLMAKTKSGWGASRANYMAELLVERLTGIPTEGYTNAAMQWGTETEPLARAAYAFLHDVDVQTCGFVPHPTIAMSGASPDGLLLKDGIIEIKCPNTNTMLEVLLGGTVPDKYIVQMQWQMACTERIWGDFVSFDPRLPAEMQVFVQRVERSEVVIASLEKAVVEFLAELDAKLAKLKARYMPHLLAAE